MYFIFFMFITLFIYSDDGSATLTYDTPDTITTWELSSFAISDTKGLGVTGKNSSTWQRSAQDSQT